MKPQIIWEKWIDPFGRDLDEAKWTDYDNKLDSFSGYEHNAEENDDEDTFPIKIPSNPIKVIASPLGLIPYTEHTASGKIFNFWLGHTNFNISLPIKGIIEEVDGVEILDIFTRYRFRIAIGKCFNDSEVKQSINESIYKAIEKYGKFEGQ